MLIYGIDPGMTGGIAVLTGDGIIVAGFRMPIWEPGGRRMVNGKAVSDIFDQWPPGRIVIEAVHSMPAQGVASTFTFGKAVGSVEALASSTGAQLFWVTPQKWKRRMQLSADKEHSTLLATALFGSDRLWRKKVENGIAEAALIAYDHLTHDMKVK